MFQALSHAGAALIAIICCSTEAKSTATSFSETEVHTFLDDIQVLSCSLYFFCMNSEQISSSYFYSSPEAPFILKAQIIMRERVRKHSVYIDPLISQKSHNAVLGPFAGRTP